LAEAYWAGGLFVSARVEQQRERPFRVGIVRTGERSSAVARRHVAGRGLLIREAHPDDICRNPIARLSHCRRRQDGLTGGERRRDANGQACMVNSLASRFGYTANDTGPVQQTVR
jgi:hypothetical protein